MPYDMLYNGVQYKTSDLIIRPIKKEDNQAIEKIIKSALIEFKANKPGTVYYDPQTSYLFEYYEKLSRSGYFIAVLNGEILGGAGYGPTDDSTKDTCELQKLYLSPNARGLGIGYKLINYCLNKAGSKDYKNMYLETLPELKSGIKLYKQMGFHSIEKPLGNTGHNSCDVWMIKKI